MPTSLLAIAKKARESRKHRFHNLYHLLNRTNLRACFHELRKKAAPGVDDVAWRDYESNLEENLTNLVHALKHGGYRARPTRRKFIPKSNGKMRPLGIPCVEDKIVQRAVARILGAIYEEDFLDVSFGYRPGKSPQAATKELAQVLQFGPYGWIVEADLKGFFDSIDHEWLLRMLDLRIGDRQIMRLIRKWLHAGVLETDGKIVHPETGTPQGGIVSPILANVYLHYALDVWFQHIVAPRCRGRAKLVRFADDFTCAFQYHEDAVKFRRSLDNRLGKFSLALAPEKTRVLQFSRFRVGGESFDFLGFEFRPRGAKSRLGRYFVSFLPAVSKKAAKSIRSVIRGWRLHRLSDKSLLDLSRMFNPIIRGWINYYGSFYRSALYPLFDQLNRSLKKWAMRKYKRLRGRQRRAAYWLRRIRSQQPSLFSHWQLASHLVAGR